ncbi:hypothetical protein LCGC14_2875620 [marine sediment metagenome]|uniref:Uncharacterized protein n=1 Tax=marine sediment metagenome TaxID=412755 RepID=A0A0F8Y1S9_9ZZZZ
MNQDQLNRYRNNIISYVKCYPVKRNIVNLNTHNSVEHEQIKFRICYELKKQGIHFVTEAKMHDGKKGIADILILDKGEVIEICVSETLDEVKEKVVKYPSMLEIVAVKDWNEYFSGNYKLIREKEM